MLEELSLINGVIPLLLAAIGGVMGYAKLQNNQAWIRKEMDDMKSDVDKHINESDDIRERLVRIETKLETVLKNGHK